jgi:hypothetical protein
MTDESLEEFEENYMTMQQQMKWQLKSGRKVEDVIYNMPRTFLRNSRLLALGLNTNLS